MSRDQVESDVRRTKLEIGRQKEVTKLILETLEKEPLLNYYQGYHDIAAAYSKSEPNLTAFTLTRLRDFMTPTMDQTIAIVELVPELLPKVDHELGSMVKNIPPYYCLSPIITCFCHDSNDEERKHNILGEIAVNGTQFLIYLYLSLALIHKDSIIKGIDTEADDKSIVHHYFSQLSNKIDATDYEKLVTVAHQLQRRYPLRKCRAFKSLSGFSCVKDRDAHQTLKYARHALEKLSAPVSKPPNRLVFFMAAFVLVAGFLATHRGT